jgi:hypothetical protein
MPRDTRTIGPIQHEIPLEERIRQRAYELYVQRGNQSGSDLDDWLQAEEELLRQQEDAGEHPVPAAPRK